MLGYPAVRSERQVWELVPKRIPLGFSNLAVPAGSHIACTCSSEEERQNCRQSIMEQLHDASTWDSPFARLSFHGDTPIVHTGEELDIYTGLVFEDLANLLIREGHRELVIDLTSTRFIDASSIGGLLRIALSLEQNCGRLTILDPSDPPRKVFRLVGLKDRIPIYTQLDGALRSLKSPEFV